jgi:hypothetical protein
MRPGPEIPYIVDINPHKQGKHVPGTGHPVVPPAVLREDPPDTVIVMNPIYREEIATLMADIGLGPEIISVDT